MAKATIAYFEAEKRAPYDRTLAEIQRALEAAGVEFTDGDQPGVRLKKPVAMKSLNPHEREAAAESYARDWTAYCKEREHESMAFVSASGDRILIQYRRRDSAEEFNLATLRVLESGFEIDGEIVGEAELQRRVRDLLDSKPKHV